MHSPVLATVLPLTDHYLLHPKTLVALRIGHTHWQFRGSLEMLQGCNGDLFRNLQHQSLLMRQILLC